MPIDLYDDCSGRKEEVGAENKTEGGIMSQKK